MDDEAAKAGAGVAVDVGLIGGVTAGVGLTGDMDLDDPFDSRDVRVDREDLGNE